MIYNFQIQCSLHWQGVVDEVKMKIDYKDMIDQELIYTALAFLAFGFYLMFSSNLNFVESIMTSIGLFAYLVLPGYFFTKYLGFKGVTKVGISFGTSIVLMMTTLYILNQFFGVLLSRTTLIIVILLLDSAGFLLWNSKKKPKQEVEIKKTEQIEQTSDS